jgi:signal transduction histidine kinase
MFSRFLPRRTVRLRLTLLYGALFTLCGIVLLALTNLLLRHAVMPAPGMRLFQYPGLPADPPPPQIGPFGFDAPASDVAVKAEDAMVAQREDVLHQLLVQSAIALATVVVLALMLGWLVAGRILRRLRTITVAAKNISATNLHRRLALRGPADELKELGDTFDALLGRLDASFQAQRQFVANASHELRTPLARQRAIGQVVLEDPDASVESLRAAHERVLAAGVQQERLIEAMLTLTRSHAGIDVRHPFDLAEVVDEVVDTRTSPLPIRTSSSPSLVLGHRALAERLVANLVDNAIRHNVEDGWVSVSCGDGVLTVTNTGPVVPPAEVDRLVQPFQRLGPARTGSGLGLGLSIVQAIATAHDATVTVTARAEGGLEVRVSFG